ncbi:hypothetical protein AVEN_248958-1 [Araneus ventricosus]|uniref:Pre-C2HC domain-containing protein n=1 Tax=Araneus ventricosus TaxID=182803 RepID=A0A4Y2VD64_ARAVE|nr:hypothetical protein AVEN_248958-1 [Araneus ventricosus]
MAQSDDEETRSCVGDQHMQIDLDDKADSGHSTPEQYCTVCEGKTDIQHELKLMLAKQHSLRTYNRLMAELRTRLRMRNTRINSRRLTSMRSRWRGRGVLVEEYKGRNIINQCYKCNWYHHKAGECQSNARCLKCAGPHETNKCSITSTIPNPKCINCGEVGHVASYRGCKMFPKKTTPQQNRTNNFISNRSTFNPETNRIRDNFSFARVTNPQQHQEMAPPTRTYPVPSTNVQQINLTDNSLRNMVEGINELKKLLLEFPNLFSALKSLKDVKDPIAKIQILAYAISNPGTSSSG